MRIETRKIDKLGRLTLPPTYCRAIGIKNNSEIEIFISFGNIYIQLFKGIENLANEPFTGNINYVNENHRIVIPRNILNLLKISLNEKVEIKLISEKIIVSKIAPKKI